MKFLNNIVRYVKSKRSMERVKIAFVDIKDRSEVWIWKDCYGDYFLAESKLSIRVRVSRDKIRFMDIKTGGL